MADLFDGYPLGVVWDEMFGESGRARPAYAGLFASMQPIDGDELAARADLLSQTYRDAGVTLCSFANLRAKMGEHAGSSGRGGVLSDLGKFFFARRPPVQ